MSPLTRYCPGHRAYVLVVLLAIGLVACNAPSTPPPVAVLPTPVPTAPLATVTPPPPTATFAPSITPAEATITPFGYDGSAGKPTSGLRRTATWGEGIPLDLVLSTDERALFVATALNLDRRDPRDLANLFWRVPLSTPPTALALSPDGQILALALGKRVELRAAHDGRLLDTLSHSSEVRDLAFGPDGKRLATALAGESVALWDLAARLPIQRLHLRDSNTLQAPPGPLTSVAFAPDGTQVAAGDQNGNVTVWRLADATPILTGSVGMRVVTAVAFAPDGSHVVAASTGWRSEAGAVWIWSLQPATEPTRLTIDTNERMLDPLVQVAFAPDGTSIVAGTASGSLLRWAWPTGELLNEITAHGAALSGLALTSNGGILSAGRDGALRRWNSVGAPLDELEGIPAISAVATGAALVIGGGEDGSLTFWSPEGELAAWQQGHQRAINALAVSPDGSVLASGSDDGTVRLWQLPAAQSKGTIGAHQGAVLALAFAPDGQHLASTGMDGVVRLWALHDSDTVTTITLIEEDGLSATAVLGVGFTAAGALVAGTVYDGGVRLCDVQSGQPKATLQTGAGGWLIALAPGPANSLAALDDAGRLWAWGPDGAMLGRGAFADASAITATPDGRLLTVGRQGGLKLWMLSAEGPLNQAAVPSFGDSVATGPTGLIVVGTRMGVIEIWGGL
ncbi:MAG: WD40 repeat domain-containing protein [Oscillochloridaceae bacterium umkhey_bin13]